MTQLTDYANSLAQLFERRAEVNIELSHCKSDLAGRQQALIPADGWLADQGKTTIDQRKTASDTCYAEDPACQVMNKHIVELGDELLQLAAKIDGTQELAKADRWNIRKQLATMLERNQIPASDDKAPGDDGFDDVLDDTLDHALDQAAQAQLAHLNQPKSWEATQTTFDEKVAQARAVAQEALTNSLKFRDGTPVNPAALAQALSAQGSDDSGFGF
mgnify:CR=1 FL=1